MKKGLLSLLTCFSILFASQAKAKEYFKPLTAEPSAVYDSIWIDYDVKENDVLGMKIHLSFTTYNMKGMDAFIAIYYSYNDEIAGVLKDNNDKYVSTAGDVAIYKAIKPNYDPAVYKDMQLFMPYAEFDLEPGLYDLTLDAKIIYKAGGMISRLTYYDFEFTKPGSPADAVSEMKTDVLFHEMKVDYDYTEKGELGLRIHLNFSTINMKGVEAYAAVYFKLRDGDKVEGKTSTYRSKSGQLAVHKSIKPNYDESDYKDLTLFLPYDEIPGSGKIRMKMVAELIFPSGDLIKTLDEKYFLFER